MFKGKGPFIFVRHVTSPVTRRAYAEGVIKAPRQGLSGEFKFKLYDINMNLKMETEWERNLITDKGLIIAGYNETGWSSSVAVGSGTATPTTSDTALQTWMAEQFMGQDSSLQPTAGNNYRMSSIHVARFNAGVATGTINEIGCYDPTYSSAGNLCTRQLTSVAIVKNADQVLDVYYRMNRYPNLTDVTGTVLIEGVNYNYTVRPCNLADYAQPGSFGYHNPFSQMGIRIDTGSLTSSDITTYDTAPAQTGITNPWPGGSFTSHNNSAVDPYNDWQLSYALDNGLGNIRTAIFREKGHNNSAQRGWQCRLGKVSDDTPLTKTDTEELYLDFRVSWGRYP